MLIKLVKQFEDFMLSKIHLNIPVFLPIDEGMDGIVEILKNKYGN